MSDTFRQDKLKDYTVIRNAIFKDYRLSAKAKGVACQLLSLPPTWDFSIKGICTLFSDGEASIRSALTELEECGYLYRERERIGGKLGKCVYVITDSQNCEKPNVENPHVENPRVDNRAQLNTKELNTNELTTKEYSYSAGERKSRFIPPTVGEVSAYINEKGYHVNAEQFVDFYESKGWMVGKNKMKSWQACVRTWERNNQNNTRGDTQKSANPFLDMWMKGEY